MANPTTNYGFVLPEPTDLVTDLPADFDVALQGVDTRLKALQPGTTEGDLAYSSSTANTNVRLGIGTTGQNLTVVGGVPAWATPAGITAYSLLNAGGTALTGAASITISITAPKELLILMVGASAGARSFITLRPNNVATADYSVGGILIQPDNIATASEGIGSNSTDTDIRFGTMSNNAASVVNGTCFIDLTNGTGNKMYRVTAGGTIAGGAGQQLIATQGLIESSAAITGITVISSVGNFDAGTIFLYGAN